MSLLDRPQIARLVPHCGSMVLIDEVMHWDERTLIARTGSHLRVDNPLRDEQGLHIACGIEYAAQAMALHGALWSQHESQGDPGRARFGLLANVREVSFLAHRLDEDSTALTIEVSLLSGSSQVALYEFAVRSSTRALLSGRATVVLEALNLADPESGDGRAAAAGAG